MNAHMNRFRAFALLLAAAATLTSCDENAVQDIAGPATGARIRFFNFGVNAPGVNFYADNTLPDLRSYFDVRALGAWSAETTSLATAKCCGGHVKDRSPSLVL